MHYKQETDMKVTAGDTLLRQKTLLTMEAEDGSRSNHLFPRCHPNDYLIYENH